MSLLIEAEKIEANGPAMNTDIQQPACRGFINDLTVTTSTVVQARWVVLDLERTVRWAQMMFNTDVRLS